ncbi:MAG: radical SAM protein [Sorangiineae bacterium]|nr:radical SAM protein [Polyangiaceae bacterium]MEB2325112.1 radical SAM protein [Sorangiineae bacterium]
MPAAPSPAYLALGATEIRRRAERAVASLASCRACPRGCAVDRLRGVARVCATGRYARVASYYPHFGEEDCLRGASGSGTIFFASCNLRCVFCQNHDFSQPARAVRGAGSHANPAASAPALARELGPEALARVMLLLQARGCHNINLVTPEHVVPQILEALPIAIEQGLRVPLVYNTSGYDALESLALMDGVVDLYLPDFKLWSPELSARYLSARDYPEVARLALREMHRQVGALALDASGVARRGLLVRHLVMPGLVEEARSIFRFIARELSPDTAVNVMGQYHPAHRSGQHRELARRPTPHELEAAREAAREAGLTRIDASAPERLFVYL